MKIRPKESKESKKSQISLEVIYSVGILIIIFIILNGVTFNWKFDIRKTDDFLRKKNDCLMFADTITSLSNSGNNAEATLKSHYYAQVFAGGLVMVGELSDGSIAKEVTCTYTGIASDSTLKTGTFTIKNENGVVKVS